MSKGNGLSLKLQTESHPPPPANLKGKRQKDMKAQESGKQDKSKVITFRVTPEEEARYKEEADIAGLPISEYIRRRLNCTKIEPKQPLTDRQTVATLRQIGGLIKQLFRYDKITKDELDNVLNKIYNAIKVIQK